MTYQDRKDAARAAAIEWQSEQATTAKAWSECLDDWQHWCTVGKRYGLLKEWKQEGIL